jgi:hypothetical protein
MYFSILNEIFLWEETFIKLYFQFSSTRTCVDFDVEQEIRLTSKPALVKVYDYYETSKYKIV